MRWIVLASFLALAACTSARPPGAFRDGGPFHSSTLELRPDRTFSYEAWSDDGGAFWRAEGSWTWVDFDRFTTQVERVTLGMELKCGPLQPNQVWRITRHGITRDTPTFTAQAPGP
jgi:hypothetical protein